MLRWFFRYEAVHGGGAVTGVLVDPFPFYESPADAEAALTGGKRMRRSAAVDTGVDLYPARLRLASRRALLWTATTLQGLLAYFTLALWNYFHVIRLQRASRTAMTMSMMMMMMSEANATATAVLSPTDVGIAPAYLALAVAGVFVVCLVAVLTAVVNVEAAREGTRWCWWHPSFLHHADHMNAFDQDYTRAAARRTGRRPPSQHRSNSGGGEIEERERGGRGALSFSLPARATTTTPSTAPVRERPFADAAAPSSAILYVALLLAVALTVLDFVGIAQTGQQMRRDEVVDVPLTFLQIMTPIIGICVSLYALKQLATFLFTRCATCCQDALVSMVVARNMHVVDH